MHKILTYEQIDRAEWSRLVRTSAAGTWFQTPEAFDFFNEQKDLFKSFVIAIEKSESRVESRESRVLRGVCVGYVTQEKSKLKQYLTRRAIIIGGPALADDCTDEEVEALMDAVRQRLKNLEFRFKILNSPIYIETRNFNDYSRWREAFEKAGFSYKPHLNFQVHTDRPWEEIEEKIGKHRRKYIRLSLRDGVTIVDSQELKDKSERERMAHEYYLILKNLYETKIKMPLQPWSFFEQLCNLPSCHYFLIMYQGSVVGGSVCMALEGKGVYEWFACGADGEEGNIHPSSVTKYAGIRYAAENGYPVFDMMGAGEPDVPYGVRDFKSEFGGELVEYGRYLCVCKPLLYRIGKFGVRLLKRFK